MSNRTWYASSPTQLLVLSYIETKAASVGDAGGGPPHTTSRMRTDGSFPSKSP